MILYDRRDLNRMRELEKAFAENPLSNEKIVVKLEKDIYLKGTPGRCILNTYLFEVFSDFNIKDEDKRKMIYRDNYFKGKFDDYMNTCIDLIKDKLENAPVILGHLLGDMFSCFHRLAMVASETLSMDHSLMGYLRAYDENKEFRELFTNPVIKKTDDPFTVEQKYNYINKVITEADVHPLSDFIKSGVKANKMQIMGFVQVGLQPDQLDPGKVKNNTISGWLNGLRNLPDMVHLDNQALEAVIKGKNEVQEPGELGKLINVALTETKINKDVTRAVVRDCGTHDYEIVTIKSKKDLKFYRYRYIADPLKHKIVGYVDLNRDDLIGMTLHLRMLHHCHGVESVCECCVGANAKFLQDTEVFKNNIYEYGMDTIGGKFQQVISIKHSNNAFLRPVLVHYAGKTYGNLKEWVDNCPAVSSFMFDKIQFHPGTILELRKVGDNRYQKLFINGELLDIVQDKPIDLDGLTATVYIANDSVLLTAKDIQVMLRMHSSNSQYVYPEEKWDRSKLRTMSRAEQVSSFYQYCKTKVKFDHSMYYEMIVHAMMRDTEDMSSKPSAETKNVDFIHINQLTSSADKSKRIANRIHHGYIKANLNSIIPAVEPCEADVLYNIIGDRDLSETAITNELYGVLRNYNKDTNVHNENTYEQSDRVIQGYDDDYDEDEED